MINITDAASFDRALEAPIAPEIKRLLTQRRDQLLTGTGTGGEHEIGELAQFVVIEPPDTTAEIEAVAGYPIVNDPAFEWVQDHGGVFEAITILSDDGFGVVLIVPDDDRIELELIGMLRSLAVPAQPANHNAAQAGVPATP